MSARRADLTIDEQSEGFELTGSLANKSSSHSIRPDNKTLFSISINILTPADLHERYASVSIVELNPSRIVAKLKLGTVVTDLLMF